AVGLVPLLVEADEADGGRVAGDLLEVLDGDAELGGHLLGPRRPAELGLELLARLLELGVLAAHQTRHPVHRAQLVAHGAADARGTADARAPPVAFRDTWDMDDGPSVCAR